MAFLLSLSKFTETSPIGTEMFLLLKNEIVELLSIASSEDNITVNKKVCPMIKLPVSGCEKVITLDIHLFLL
ncbi:hypothetical protein XBI1_500006 [Xenorhabdus bovienii str. Intermedium]|uniref:Uncharacterized protein n=1 Tax=Xenorhabdus bovienii str. Intermedium TaxID=1379677 RepID=A0A077QN69_XENBV|nr:hypothetical protein XBI1_500006 [Xenorhabdus bovienii str. Intermedium]